ncbi:S41 family peptidase [Altererythrobacter arenosus]|uniref:S41 family peptidase n=1 Tax=Altererythrobacter arenosus TaxID=3032592 RepID=A0ABY8FP77_9SPHN|nr:S41 family peptidase [Altererythrobacter sp. CAU 1644]WFL76075.1 S41 family peptidase [Altererythrobacter sp. CAU 1644]
MSYGALIAAGLASQLAFASEDGSTDSAASCATAVANSSEATACALASELERGFVYPAVGERYAAMLRGNVASGAYASLGGRELAERLTSDLQAVQSDGHLRVSVAEADAEHQPRAGSGERPSMVEQPGWIAPGIAFVRFNGFPGDSAVTAEAAKFMEEHKEAEAIIFDIRTNGGGGIDQMDVIFPWLFDKPTRLVTMATRRSIDEEMGSMFGNPTLIESGSTPQEVVREHWIAPNEHGELRDARVYVLTGPRTGSAAEHFALAMKHTGRATLVGEATYGANHFGGENLLPGGFTVFVPVGRTYDPVTGKDWEGDGVAPDVEVSVEQALEWVLRQEGIPADEAKTLSDARTPKRPLRKKAS